MSKGEVGIVILQFPDPAHAVDQIVEADRMGIASVWMTCGGLLADTLTLFAAAAVRTQRIVLGSAIVPTWPRNPVFLVQQILALEALAPGRLRVGVGPSTEGAMRPFGVDYRNPLRQLREYLIVLRALLHEGKVDFQGDQMRARARIAAPVQTPILASALQARAFELCGAHADGAISWVCPHTYLRTHALPALRRGAAAAGRAAPPLLVHTPICIEEDPARVRAATQQQLGMYGRFQFYKDMFAKSGYPDAGAAFSQALVDDLVVYGNEKAVAKRLAELAASGIGNVMAHPMLVGDDPKASLTRAFAAVAESATF
ncbi:MAG: LLM class flavin-dependent oxidoreductase [Candidatus Binatia bacterium]